MNNMVRISTVLILSVLLAAGCKQTTPPPSSPLEASLDSLFTSLIAEDEPGAFVNVTQRDTAIYNHGFGLARLDTKEPIDENTLFNLSATTKMTTSIGVMKLVEDGCLSLDDPMSKLFPDLKAPIYDRVKLCHVLSSSTGLPNTLPKTYREWEEYINSHSTVFAEQKDFLLYGDDTEYTRYLDSITVLLYEPGSRAASGIILSDPPFMLIPGLIESVTHTGYDKWMLDNILKPDNDSHATFANFNIEETPHISHAYAPEDYASSNKIYLSGNRKWAEYDYGEAPFFLSKGDNGLFISGRGYMAWRKKLFDGKIISMASLNTVYSPVASNPDRPFEKHGLGMNIIFDGNHRKKHYMLGRNGGYATIIGYFPDERLTYIVFMNRSDIDIEELMQKIDSILRIHHRI